MARTRAGKVPAPQSRLRHHQGLPTVNRQPPANSNDSSTTVTYISSGSDSESTSKRSESDKCISCPLTTSSSEAAARFIRESSENMCYAVATAFIESLKQADINTLPLMSNEAHRVYSSIQELGGDPSKLKDELDYIFELCNKHLALKKFCGLSSEVEGDFNIRDHIVYINSLRPKVIASYATIRPLEQKLEESRLEAAQIDEMIEGLKTDLGILEKEKEKLSEEILDIESRLKEKVNSLAEAPMVKRALEMLLHAHGKRILHRVNHIDYKYGGES